MRTKVVFVGIVVVLLILVSGAAGSSAAGRHAATGAASPSTTAASASWLPTGVTPAGADWPDPYGSTANGMYSTLSQINTSNVSKLKVAWQDQFPGGLPQGYQEHLPLVISGANKNLPLASGTMFLSQITGLVAMNPATGAVLWKYNGPLFKTEPNAVGKNLQGRTDRVEAYGNGAVFVGQQDMSVAALDAKTGTLLWSNSTIANGAGIIGPSNSPPAGGVTSTNAQPYVKFLNYGKDGVVLSGLTGGDSAERGHMDAFDAKTGQLLWQLWTTPDQTQFPEILTWGDPAGASYGGAALWSLPAFDPSTGLIFFGTGNVYPYTGRAPGKELWTASLLAVHADTGKIAWYFQTVHHDEWDYDVSSPPTLFNAKIGGQTVPAVSVSGKNGYVYVFSRAHGHVLKTFPIPEVPVPNLNDGAGAALNNTWPTQPEPQGGAGEVVPHCMDNASLQADGFDPSQFGAAVKYPGFPTAPNGDPIVPTCPYAPSYVGEYVLWGPSQTNGALNWQPSSYDPQTNYQYFCAIVDSGARENASPVSSILNSLISEPRASVVPGVGGTVAALNMSNNTIAWRANMDGMTADMCYSGVLSTAGGLVFAASRGTGPFTNPPLGGTVFAYDAKSGKQLWSWNNPGNDYIEAPAMTYSINGKQYIAEVVQGPPSDLSTRDRLMVFTLPNS